MLYSRSILVLVILGTSLLYENGQAIAEERRPPVGPAADIAAFPPDLRKPGQPIIVNQIPQISGANDLFFRLAEVDGFSHDYARARLGRPSEELVTADGVARQVYFITDGTLLYQGEIVYNRGFRGKIASSRLLGALEPGTQVHDIVVDDAIMPNPLSHEEMRTVDDITAVFVGGRIDPEACVAMANSPRYQAIAGPGRLLFQKILTKQYPQMESELIFHCLTSLQYFGGFEFMTWRDIISHRCRGNESEQLKWIRFLMDSNAPANSEYIAYIKAALRDLDEQSGLADSAIHLMPEVGRRSYISIESADFDADLRKDLLSRHSYAIRNRSMRSSAYADVVRRALRVRTPDQLKVMFAELSALPDNTLASSAVYGYILLALGSSDPRHAQSITAYLNEWMTSPITIGLYKEYRLLKSGYNQLLLAPYLEADALPDVPRLQRHSPIMDAVTTYIINGLPDLTRMAEIDPATCPPRSQQLDIALNLASLANRYLGAKPPGERLHILSDGHLFQLLADSKDLLPSRLGHDANALQPWVDAIMRCPSPSARQKVLDALLIRNGPVLSDSAGTRLIIDNMDSIDGIGIAFSCGVPHRRIHESLRQSLAYIQEEAARNESPPSTGRFVSLLHFSRGVVPNVEYITLLDEQMQKNESGIFASALFATGCIALGSSDPRYKDAVRQFLVSGNDALSLDQRRSRILHTGDPGFTYEKSLMYRIWLLHQRGAKYLDI